MSMTLAELVRGAEGPWLAFAASAAATAALTAITVRVDRRARRPDLARLARDEEGVSYSLPFTILVPFYLFFVIAVFEIGFVLLAKIGTKYAAHAGARSATVWRWADP